MVAPSFPNCRTVTLCSFPNPTSSWMLCFAWFRACFNKRFTSSSTMLDVCDIAFLFYKVMNIWIIVSFVCTQMLLFLLRALDHNRDNQFISRPLIMLIGTHDMDDQWHPLLIHQEVQFRPLLARSVGFLPVSLPPSGAGTDLLLSMDCAIAM